MTQIDVRLEDVTKTYGPDVVAVDHITLDVMDAEFFSLLGPSGCGKSTLMRSLVGVQIVEGGAIRVLGEPAGSAPLRHRVGYMGQDDAVYADLTARENLEFAAEMLGGGHADIDALIETISKGAAQSWQLDNRGKTMAADKFDFGFAVDWMRKDLGLVMDEAKRNGARVPVTALVDQFYADVQQLGGSRWDTSSLIKRLR